MQRTVRRRLSEVGARPPAGDMLVVPPVEWLERNTLSFSQEKVREGKVVPGALVVVADEKAAEVDAIMQLNRIEGARPDPKRNALLVHDYTLIWPPPPQPPKDDDDTIPALPMEEETLTAAADPDDWTAQAAQYAQLLLDASLLDRLARQRRKMPEEWFTTLRSAWGHNRWWLGSEADCSDMWNLVAAELAAEAAAALPDSDHALRREQWLRAEYVVAYLRSFAQLLVDRNPPLAPEHTPLTRLAAEANRPWVPLRSAGGRQREAVVDRLVVAPYAHRRRLALWTPAFVGPRPVDTGLVGWTEETPLEMLLDDASPELATAVRQWLLTVPPQTEQTLDQVLKTCRDVRPTLTDLEDIFVHLPPCMRTVRCFLSVFSAASHPRPKVVKHGREYRHLKFNDRYALASMLYTIGERDVDEATHFGVRRSASDPDARDLMLTLKGVFATTDTANAQVRTCKGIRDHGAYDPHGIGNRPVCHCPYETTRDCGKAAGLPTSPPMAYPGNFVRLSLLKKAAAVARLVPHKQ